MAISNYISLPPIFNNSSLYSHNLYPRFRNYPLIFYNLENINSQYVKNTPKISNILPRRRCHFGKPAGQLVQCIGVPTFTNSEERIEKETTWVDLYVPEAIRPYAQLARVHKPIGTWLWMAPPSWAIALAANPGTFPDMKVLALCCIWAFVLRSCACTINDFVDRDFDGQVERTKNRPFPSGTVSPAQGLLFFGFQVIVTLLILHQINTYSVIVGAINIPLVVAYPFMKRITYWPQAFLGIMFSFGSLVGWVAVKGSFHHLHIVLPLYISGAVWILLADTIYAHQDKEDDIKVGVKSTALKFGDSTKRWITGFAVVCISTLALTGILGKIGWSYYIILVVASLHLAWQIIKVDLSSQADCNRKFVANKWFGAIIFASILVGRLHVRG